MNTGYTGTNYTGTGYTGTNYTGTTAPDLRVRSPRHICVCPFIATRAIPANLRRLSRKSQNNLR